MLLLLAGLLFTVVLNTIIFLIAFKKQTDTLTDLTYSLSFLGLVVFMLLSGRSFDSVSKLIILGLVALWAIRLGWFLYRRIHQMGHDSRFDHIRVSKKRFFRFFMIQGFGAWIISLPMMVRVLSPQVNGFDHFESIEWLGVIIAILGFLLEAIADGQKMHFKSKEGNAKKLFKGGLFSIVRYPNYLGEIMFWVGIFLTSVSYLSGFQWIVIISPIFITLLLIKVSGIPFLERSRQKAYGQDVDYQEYVQKTKMLIPAVF